MGNLSFKLPKSWELFTLGEVSSKPQYGWTTKASKTGDKLKLLRTTDISSGHVNWETVPTCIKEPAEPSKYFLNDGDIVVARAGSVGKSFLIREDVTDAVFASYLVRFTPSVDSRYVNYFMQSRFYWNQIEEQSAGIAVPNVNASKLANLEIPIAPLNEQRRIVEKIETLFAHIDKGEEALREVPKLLKRYRQSILKAAVTGELTRDWREANQHKLEPATDLLERILENRSENWQGRRKYKEPTAPEESNQFSGLPESWALSTTEQLAFVETGATPKKSEPSYYSAQEIPWITSTAVNEDPIQTPQAHITEKALKDTNAKVFPAGTLIVALYGEGRTRGKVSELAFESATNQACAALLVQHLPSNVMRYLKLFYLYNYEAIRRKSAGGVQPNLNLSIIKATQVPLPSQDEMRKILVRVNAELSKMADLDLICSKEIIRSTALRQSILKSAFTGQLVPQNPDDEPASELLARIQPAMADKSNKGNLLKEGR